jgi:cytochrome bd-type quinol oxidase subunit 2
MCFNDSSQSCAVTIIIIFILVTIKHEFYNNTHLYEFIKVVIAIFLIIFILYLYFVLIKKFYCNNRIVPEENDIENNNKEITVPPDVVHS